VGRALLLALAVAASPACLVLTVHPSHTRETQVWEPALLGEWHSPDDNSSVTIRAGEWQSFDLDYAHPVEKGRLTGYLFTIGDALYLDVMPARGEDRGSFLLPLHAVFRIRVEPDRLELVALSYDWFFDRLKKKAPISGLDVVLDEKENALIVSPPAALRSWIKRQPAEGLAFSPPAVFVRKKS
jgi:hypothetical protein